jgi:outer membrane receptor for ferrienterochelin and colicins
MNWMRLTCLLGGIVVSSAGVAAGASDPDDDTTATLDDLLSIPISTASRYAQSSREAPASVTLVTSEEIEHLGFQTIAEVISFVRGFYLSYDRDYSYVGVRGFSRPTDYNNRIQLQLNGHPLNENVYGSALLGTEFGLTLEMIDRIEVVRGPGSALYGSTAVFAVVNVITRDGENVSGVHTSVDLGSNRLSRGSVLAGTRMQSDIDASVSGTWFDIGGEDLYYKEFDTPETNDGIARRGDWDRGFGIQGVATTGGLTVQGMLSHRDKGVPTASYGSDFNDGRESTTDHRWFVDASYHHDLGVSSRIQGRLSVDGYEYAGTYPLNGFQHESSLGLWNSAEVNFQWDTHTFNRIDFGVSYTWNRHSDYFIWQDDVELFSTNAPYNFGSVYLQNTSQVLSNLSISLAARADRHSRVGWMITPRVALIYNPWEEGTIKLLYGQAFRAPTVYELYYEDGLTQRANPALKHEMSRTEEIAFEQRLSSWLIMYASVYRFTASDLIDLVVDPVDSMLQYRNFSEARARGAEIELLAKLPGAVTIGASAAMQKADDQSTDQTLSNSPKVIIRGHCIVPVVNHLSVGCLVRYESSRLTVYNTSTDPFFIANVHVKIDHILGCFEASAGIKNLFNTTYSYPGGVEHLQPSIVQDGRTFTVHVGARF